MPVTLLPELAYIDGAFLAGQALVIGADGRLLSVGATDPSGLWSAGESVRLPRRAILPGLVNSHSHAFQRLLRGRTEWRTAAPGNFWTWRDRMYAIAGKLDPEGLRAVCAMTFLEMALAGVTAVGEFHYLHRDRDGHSYADSNELALMVIAAAEEVGLRIVLLRSAYSRAGANRMAEGVQRRFVFASLDGFLADTEALIRSTHGRELVSVGIAPHSVRALDRRQLIELARAARERGWLTHMHLAELTDEVDGCVAETGLRSVELAAECGLLETRFCAIHAIHVEPHEIDLLGQSQITVCGCPTTEADLADGVVPAAALHAAGVKLALGTDSQVQIDLFQEARSLEFNLRLVQQKRVLIGAVEGVIGDEGALSRTLFAAASLGGAKALGLPRAVLASGAPADLIAVDLDDPSLAGAVPGDLLGALVFGGQVRAIREVMVHGRFIVRDGQHPRASAIRERFDRAMTSLGGAGA